MSSKLPSMLRPPHAEGHVHAHARPLRGRTQGEQPPCAPKKATAAARPGAARGLCGRATAVALLVAAAILVPLRTGLAAPQAADEDQTCGRAIAVGDSREAVVPPAIVAPGPNLGRIESLTHPGSLGAFETGIRARPLKRMGAHASDLLRRELAGLQRLLDMTARDSPDRPGIVRRLFLRYVELANAAAFDMESSAERARWFRRLGASDQARELDRQAALAGQWSELARREVARHGESLLVWVRSAAAAHGGEPVDSNAAAAVLFEMGRQLELAGAASDARRAYQRLLLWSPQSPLANEARLALAEIGFEQATAEARLWPEVERAYRALRPTTPRGTRLHDYLQYKLAHSLWQQGKLEDALSELGALAADRARRGPDASDVLGEAATRDALLLYAVAGEPTAAPAQLSAWAATADEHARLLATLATLYREMAALDRAYALHRSMAEHAPAVVACRQWSFALEAALDGLGQQAHVARALQELLDAETRTGLADVGAAERRECTHRTAALAVEVALRWRAQALDRAPDDDGEEEEDDTTSGAVAAGARTEPAATAEVAEAPPPERESTSSKTALAQADELLETVLSRFGPQVLEGLSYPRLAVASWPTYADLRRAHAALEGALGHWRRCGELYAALADGETTPTRRAEAALGSASCYASLLTTGGRALDEPSRSAARAAFDRYDCWVAPAKDDAVARERHAAIALADALLRLDDGLDAESLEALRAVAVEAPDTAAGSVATEIYGRRWSERWGRAAPLGDPARQRARQDVQLLRSYHCARSGSPSGDSKSMVARPAQPRSATDDASDACRAIGLIARQLDRWDADDLFAACPHEGGDRGPCARAAAAYRAIWQTYGAVGGDDATADREAVAEVLSRGATSALRAGEPRAALALLIDLVEPHTPLADTAVARSAALDVGRAYRALDQRQAAADWYERFARRVPTDERAPAALVDALVLEIDLGASVDVRRLARLYRTRYRGRDLSLDGEVDLAVGTWLSTNEAWREADAPLRSAALLGERGSRPDVVLLAQTSLARAARRSSQPGRAAEASAVACAAWDRAGPRLDELLLRSPDRPGTEDRRRRIVAAAGESLLACARAAEEASPPAPLPAFRGAPGTAQLERFVDGDLDDWLRDRKARIERLARGYERVVELPAPGADGTATAASKAAVAQLWTELADELRDAPHPAEWNQLGIVPGSEPPVLWAELRTGYRELLRARGLGVRREVEVHLGPPPAGR